MSDERPPISERARSSASAEIQRLIENPPVRLAVDEAKRYPESEQAKGNAAAEMWIAAALKHTGMTRAQLEAEWKKISYPRESIPFLLTPKVLARRRMTDASVPEEFRQDLADRDPVDCDALRAVKTFLDSKDGFLFLCGGIGTMKTGSACFALGQVDHGRYVRALDVTRLSIEDKPKWRAVLEAPLVVFDDLGWESGDSKGAFLGAFSDLIDTVAGSRHRLIVTGNIEPDDFKKHYGAREYDRFRQRGKWAFISGGSVREYREHDAPLERPHWTDREPGSDDE